MVITRWFQFNVCCTQLLQLSLVLFPTCSHGDRSADTVAKTSIKIYIIIIQIHSVHCNYIYNYTNILWMYWSSNYVIFILNLELISFFNLFTSSDNSWRCSPSIANSCCRSWHCWDTSSLSILNWSIVCWHFCSWKRTMLPWQQWILDSLKYPRVKFLWKFFEFLIHEYLRPGIINTT